MTSNLRNSWGGIWRLAVRRHFTRGHLLALAGMLAVFALILLSFLRAGNGREQFLPFMVAFYFTFLVPLLAFIAGGGAWRDDLKPEVADYVFVRAVPKGTYLLFRYGAHLVCAQLDFAAALALLAALGSMRGVPGLGGAFAAMLAAQALSVAAFAAFGFFCAALTARWVILGLLYGAVVEMGIGQVPLAINRLAMTHQARVMLHAIASRAWSGPDALDLARGGHTLAAAGILALFTLGWAAAGAALFSRAELAGMRTGEE